MKVDRARRDGVAEVLASFLRCEIRREDVNALLEPYQSLDDRNELPNSDIDQDSDLDIILYGWSFEHALTGPISRERWEDLCRDLAFLKSDLQIREWEDRISPADTAESSPRMTMITRWHLAGVIVAWGIASVTSWWVILAGHLISYILYNYFPIKDANLNDEKRQWDEAERKRKEDVGFYPFADRKEWLAHKDLLDQFKLPEFDPARYYQLSPTMKMLQCFGDFLFYLTLGICFVFIVSFVVPVWPLFLIGVSFQRLKSASQSPLQPEARA